MISSKKGIGHLRKLRKYGQTDFCGHRGCSGEEVSGLWEPSLDLRMVHEIRLTIANCLLVPS